MSNPSLNILSSNYCHYFDNAINPNSIINTIRPTNPSSVTLLDEVHTLKSQWTFSYQVKLIKQQIDVSICLGDTKSCQSKLMNSD